MKQISILVCVPTVPGRQASLVNCVRSYERSTPTVWHEDHKTRVELNFSVVHDAMSAGEGWQRCADQGLEWWPETCYLHFTNDDVMVGDGWLEPLVEACGQDKLPAMRIEPLGGHVDEQVFSCHLPMPPRGVVRRDPVAYFYADLPENQPVQDWVEIDHGNLPFCDYKQWEWIKPFPPCHYGTDRWFAERGRRMGWQTVARQGSVAFNLNTNVGRHRGDWEEQDFAAFDGVFAMPAYLAGVLESMQPHPLRETLEGLEWVRAWRQAHETSQFYGPDVNRDLMTDEGRFKLLREVLAR